VLNKGESHVVLVDITLGLHHFLSLLEVPNKSHDKMSNEKPLIDYSRSIMIMNEHYLVAFEQKLVRKEVAI
jgi:hypothetical protein